MSDSQGMSWDLNLQDPNQSEPSQSADDGFSDFGNQYIQNIPEEDRAVVSKYVREWDGNVTRRFQDLQGQLKQFEEYGSPEEIAQARMVVNMINEDPLTFYHNLDQYIRNHPQLGKQLMPSEETPNDFGLGEDFDDLPEAVRNALQEIPSLKQQLEAVSSTQAEDRLTRQQQEEAAMLDSALEDLHNEHGDFDDRWVVMQIAQGASPEEAVQSWNELTQSIIDSRSRKPAPTLMGSGNGVPVDQVDPQALRNPATRKKIGADYIKAALGD